MSQVKKRRALTGTEVVTLLANLEGWRLDGDGTAVVIQKTFRFAAFAQTMAFVNAVAWLSQDRDHHPELIVQFNNCTVRYNTHDVAGLSQADFDAAAAVDALPGAAKPVPV